METKEILIKKLYDKAERRFINEIKTVCRAINENPAFGRLEIKIDNEETLKIKHHHGNRLLNDFNINKQFFPNYEEIKKEYTEKYYQEEFNNLMQQMEQVEHFLNS